MGAKLRYVDINGNNVMIRTTWGDFDMSAREALKMASEITERVSNMEGMDDDDDE